MIGKGEVFGMGGNVGVNRKFSSSRRTDIHYKSHTFRHGSYIYNIYINVLKPKQEEIIPGGWVALIAQLVRASVL